MSHKSLQAFIRHLEMRGQLKRISQSLSPHLEITEVCQRTLKAQGPALLFENPQGYDTPVLGNLFGTVDRVIDALGLKSLEDLRNVGEMLAFMKEPSWPGHIGEALEKLPRFRKLIHVTPRRISAPPCQEVVIEGKDVDIYQLPISKCWPEDADQLISFGLVITKGPYKERQNIGIYRQQLLAPNKVIMRWLQHRGGAIDYQEWQQANPGKPFPLAVSIGPDPATLLAAVTPIPDTLSEYQFAGLLRGSRSEVADCLSIPLQVPASSQYVLEGHIYPGEEAEEGPFGDHTGYYNSRGMFPVFTIEKITQRSKPIYHTTYMGRSPFDEPSILAMSLNEVFIPILQKQFPEIVDFYLPPEACSYRIAVVSIKKRYPGHARRIMFGIWSYLRQFTYTKFVIVTDEDINVRDWNEVIWALSTKVDPARDVCMQENTAVDYLDFASPVAGLGSKMGIDATNKTREESARNWGKPIQMSPDVVTKIDQLWDSL